MSHAGSADGCQSTPVGSVLPMDGTCRSVRRCNSWGLRRARTVRTPIFATTDVPARAKLSGRNRGYYCGGAANVPTLSLPVGVRRLHAEASAATGRTHRRTHPTKAQRRAHCATKRFHRGYSLVVRVEDLKAGIADPRVQNQVFAHSLPCSNSDGSQSVGCIAERRSAERQSAG
jgi:hypothetical protein